LPDHFASPLDIDIDLWRSKHVLLISDGAPPSSANSDNHRIGMSTNTGSFWPSLATLGRAALALLAALLIGSAGLWLLILDSRVGPSAQRVNIRWTPDTAADPDKRVRAQDTLRLTAGEETGPRTWSYHLADRSQQTIGQILSNPSVEDTHFLDRDRLRVTIDQPDLPAWLREVLEGEWAPLVGLLLLIAAAVPSWFARRQIAAAPRELRHVSRTASLVAGAAAGAVAARTHAVVVMPAVGAERRPAVPGLQWTEVAAGLVMGLVSLAPLLAYAPTDAEELGLGMFSSQIFYRALFDGRWPFWLNDLGFGTPMPIGHRLDFHPVFAVASLSSLWAALSALWIVHVAVMAVYFLRLLTASGIRPPLRTVVLACYVFSMPSACYFYQTDWISVIVGWTLFPVIVFYVHRAVRDASGEAFWVAAGRLGLLLGIWILNAHPAYLATLATVLAVYALVLAPVGARVYSCLLTALMLATSIAAQRIWFTLSELREFPVGLQRLMYGGYTLSQHARTAAVPLTDFPSDPRGPFVGIVIGIAALSVVLNAARENDRHVRASAIAFAVAAALSMAPVDLVPVRVFSAIWQFRDPMVFFALLAGGVALQRALDSFRPAWRMAIWCCVMLQVVQQGITIWPGFSGVQQSRSLHFYRYQYSAVGIGAVITQRAALYGSRLYVSNEVFQRMQGYLSHEGLHSITDLVFLGVNPVNASFKGVSMDRISPSSVLARGMIGGQQEVIENDALLDVLGVNLIMQAAGEGPLLSTLRVTDHLRPRVVGPYDGPAHDILVLANENAWPKAVLLDNKARTVALPFRSGCPHSGALCRDYTALAASRLPEPVRLAASDGRYSARFAPSDRERLLFLSVLYRREWRATAASEALRVVPLADAFVSVIVPPGVEEIELRFVPRVLIALSWFSGGIFTILLIGVGRAEASRVWRRLRRSWAR